MEPVKRGRGRPRKEKVVDENVVKRGRGRPRKNVNEAIVKTMVSKYELDSIYDDAPVVKKRRKELVYRPFNVSFYSKNADKKPDFAPDINVTVEALTRPQAMMLALRDNGREGYWIRITEVKQ